MFKKSLVGMAMLAVVTGATLGTPSSADAHPRYYGHYTPRYYSAPVAYPVHRSYYYSTPVVYSAPVVYSRPVYYSTPVVYAPAPVVYTRPACYSRPYYYSPSSFSFGYYGGHRHGGVSVRVGY